MGSWLDKHEFARVPDLSEDVGDVGDDEAAWRGSQGLDVTFAVLKKFAASYVSFAMSVASLDGEGGETYKDHPAQLHTVLRCFLCLPLHLGLGF